MKKTTFTEQELESTLVSNEKFELIRAVKEFKKRPYIKKILSSDTTQQIVIVDGRRHTEGNELLNKVK